MRWVSYYICLRGVDKVFDLIDDNKSLLLINLSCKTSINNEGIAWKQPKWKSMGNNKLFSTGKVGRKVWQGVIEILTTGNNWMNNWR